MIFISIIPIYQEKWLKYIDEINLTLCAFVKWIDFISPEELWGMAITHQDKMPIEKAYVQRYFRISATYQLLYWSETKLLIIVMVQQILYWSETNLLIIVMVQQIGWVFSPKVHKRRVSIALLLLSAGQLDRSFYLDTHKVCDFFFVFFKLANYGNAVALLNYFLNRLIFTKV